MFNIGSVQRNRQFDNVPLEFGYDARTA
jgi:hypothetical protein